MLQEEPRHCYLKFEEFNSLLEEASQQRKNFLDYFDVWDHVIYSPSSQWGVMISRDDGKHGLIAGNKEFVQSIESFIPDFSFEKQVHNFLHYWSFYTHDDERNYYTYWILPLLVQVYGEEKAEHLLEQYDMRSKLSDL